MSGHTPGPWAWTGKSGSKLPVLEGSNGSEVMDFGDDETFYPTEGNPPGEADARLIEAAPEMLEVLRAVAEELDNRSDVRDGEDGPRANWAMQLLRDVDQVLAKVEGR